MCTRSAAIRAQRIEYAIVALLTVLAAALCVGCTDAAAAGTSGQAETPLTLEFDLPDEFLAKNADGSDVVTKFRVGYFQGNEQKALATFEVRRGEVMVRGRTGHILVPRNSIPRANGPLVVRMQTVTRDGSSAWSAAVPVGADAAAAAPPVPAPPASRRAMGKLSMADVEHHPRLLEAFRQTLSTGVDPTHVLAAFGTLEALATAVVICRDHQLPLEGISKAVVGPPGRSLLSAVQSLKPSLNGRVVRKAAADGKQLLEVQKPQ